MPKAKPADKRGAPARVAKAAAPKPGAAARRAAVLPPPAALKKPVLKPPAAKRPPAKEAAASTELPPIAAVVQKQGSKSAPKKKDAFKKEAARTAASIKEALEKADSRKEAPKEASKKEAPREASKTEASKKEALKKGDSRKEAPKEASKKEASKKEAPREASKKAVTRNAAASKVISSEPAAPVEAEAPPPAPVAPAEPAEAAPLPEQPPAQSQQKSEKKRAPKPSAKIEETPRTAAVERTPVPRSALGIDELIAISKTPLNGSGSVSRIVRDQLRGVQLPLPRSAYDDFIPAEDLKAIFTFLSPRWTINVKVREQPLGGRMKLQATSQNEALYGRYRAFDEQLEWAIAQVHSGRGFDPYGVPVVVSCVIEGVFLHGVSRGITQYEQDVQKQLGILAKLGQLVGDDGTPIEPFEIHASKVRLREAEQDVAELRRWLERFLDVDAAPGTGTEDGQPFTGRRSDPPFAELLTSGGGDHLDRLIRAVMLQGTALGLAMVDAAYGARLADLQDKIAALVQRNASLANLQLPET